jgi:hypothetical protein
LDARDAHNRKEWEREQWQRAHEENVDRALTSRLNSFRESVKPHMENISEEVLSLRAEFQLADGEQPTGENWITNELVFSPESAPALMLHFTAHPEELQRIAALPNPRAVSREMAKLEARLDAATTGASSKRDSDVSRAAPPVKPVTGKPYVTESGYREGMSLDEYYKIRSKSAIADVPRVT